MENNLELLTTLDVTIRESSGLIYSDQQLWTHNDGGGGNKLLQISTTEPKILDSLIITNAINKDWEDISQDDTHFYIGDFGNNAGTRQDLRIYKIPKTFNSATDTASLITFKYSDQLNFDGPLYQHNYDCEAMIIQDNTIYLFSKSFLDRQTRLYQLPATSGNHTAQLLDTFNSDGLITGASLDTLSNTLCLLGYDYDGVSFHTFVWMFWDFTSPDFFEGKSVRVNLDVNLQFEGISTNYNGDFFISSENENNNPARLYLFDAEKWKQ